jgi:SAM-dependent methyltransferase
MKAELDDKILAFWNERSRLGETAGTNDFVLSNIERDFLCEFIPAGSRVLDIGCGSGRTLVELGHRAQCTGVGIDYAEGMVRESQKAVVEAGLSDRIQIHHRRTPPITEEFGLFDVVYSQRCLINYTSTELQRAAVTSAAMVLKPGGMYVMLECSIDGTERTNVLRRRLGLEPLSPPWHNLFFREEEVAGWGTSLLGLERLMHMTSTYHFLSRVVNARLAADKGEEPQYDAAVNLMALALPRDIGEFGSSKAWIWRRS